ncbi:MAG: choline-sulfatase [Rhodobacteraceae bacterium]|nr:choline-sulfatase [Paracoccaceae bacterium]MYF47350.1 choline-sulfatase [Paracoccaceae bacterium]MYI90354.1 choline-sulfatase [Paracoccaceae bacterium]
MPQSKPNFLLIMADQFTAKALRALGNKTVITPNLDRLIEKGVLFENCYCNLPMCAPSRASLHTGKLPFDIGMYDNANEFPSDLPTFAHYLRNLGYRVELTGKMHFVGPDQYHGYEKRHTTEIYPANFAWTVDWSKGRTYRPTNLTMAPIIESGPCIRSLQMDYDDEVAYTGCQALYDLARKYDERPFFLTVSFTSPHSPFVIGQKYWDLYDHEAIELPEVPAMELANMDHLSRNLHYCQARDQYTVTDEHRRMARHGYYGMISYIDDKVGQLLSILEETGLDDSTITIFTSDHGEMMGERGMWFKQHFFDWAAKVPLIFHSPKDFGSATVGTNVSLVDLLPTFMDLASGKEFEDYSMEIDGSSLVGSLGGTSEGLDDTVISEFAADGSTGPSRMIKIGPWKYMWLEGVDELLYNLDDDPNEVRNLSADPDYAAQKQSLKHVLLDGWDPVSLRKVISESQRRRLSIHKATGGVPTNVNIARIDDEHRYVRNAGAADTKAKARLPYVAPVKPDVKAKG